MTRTSDLKKRMRKVAAGLFLAAALSATGCGNALVNPQVDQTATGTQTALASGHAQQPSGHVQQP